MNIYVGNLAWKTRQKELRELFENFGEVTNAFIVRDKKTRRSRGFGFVEMAEEKDALEAIEKLNNTVFLERTIVVNEALPKNDEDNDEDDYSGAEEPADEKPVAEEPADEKPVAEDSGDDKSADDDDSGLKPSKNG